jgi:tRNA-dihydrouridine synthase B
MKNIRIGNINVDYPIFLAPMAGITDYPYRQIVSSFGSSMMYSEMISSVALTRNSEKSNKMSMVDSNLLTGIQLAGSNVDTLIKALKLSQDNGAILVDINMGCPVKKVVNGIAGSALMKEEVLAGKIMESLVKASSVPITVKMRLGWDSSCMNAPKLAYIAQESGISLVTIHGRTRQQFFNDNANWMEVKKVCDAVKIPVIVNGDIKSIEDMEESMAQSGASGVMIGRATYGKPWLINQLIHYIKTGEKLADPNNEEKLRTALKHYDLLLDFYGQDNGLRIARKHLSWYTKGLRNSASLRAKLNVSEDVIEIKDIVSNCFNNDMLNIEDSSFAN